ncbi:MAG TPA: hypothetical protein PLE48_01820 [Thiobacillus sp.]|nr:hypothetical protein [Thiobacillus sp.]HQT69147.1 hypothetical protein [Thiobacillus sp.]
MHTDGIHRHAAFVALDRFQRCIEALQPSRLDAAPREFDSMLDQRVQAVLDLERKRQICQLLL